MKKDVRKKIRPRFAVSSQFIRQHLLDLLKLTEELETGYQSYAKLRQLVGYEAWQQLTDVPYRQLLDLNRQPANRQLRDDFGRNVLWLEDLAMSMLTRDQSGLHDTLTRVLRYRLVNGLAMKGRV